LNTNINDLTIGEAKELANLFGHSGGGSPVMHPMQGKHCVVRSYAEGVHIGTVKQVDGKGVLLTGARRLWSWKGAFTLSEVATSGVSKDSRLAVELPEIYILEAESMIPTTSIARKTFEACHEK